MVLVRDRATFHTVFRCVAGFGGVHFLILGCLAFTPVGLWVIDELHAVDPGLGSVVRRALGYLLPFPLIVGITRFLSGLLLGVRRTDIVSYAMMTGMGMCVLAVFVFLPTPIVQSDPILLPVIATYFGVLTELAVMIYGYRRFVRLTLRRSSGTSGTSGSSGTTGENAAEATAERRAPVLTAGYVLRFYWPLAVTSGIQALSRPIINLFVARGADGTESLAVLTIVYALGPPALRMVERTQEPAAGISAPGSGRPVHPAVYGRVRSVVIRRHGPDVLDPGAVLSPGNPDRRGPRIRPALHRAADHLLLLSPGRHGTVLPARRRAARPPDGRHCAQRTRPGPAPSSSW